MHGMHTQQAPNRLAELMATAQCRPAEIAVAIDRDVTMVNRYSRGLTPIPDDIKSKLAAYFGVTRAYLMGWDETPSPGPKVGGGAS